MKWQSQDCYQILGSKIGSDNTDYEEIVGKIGLG